MQDYNPSNIILHWIKAGNNKPFIQFGNTEHTYSETHDIIYDKINAIKNQGIPKGSIIGITTDYTIDNLLSVLAILCSDDYIYSPIFDPINTIYADYAFSNNHCTPFRKAINHTLDQVTRNQLAYLAYTSGTTGTKKVVLASKSNLASFLSVSDQYFDGLFQNHLMLFDLSFDGSLASLLWTLIYSGTLHVIDQSIKHHPTQLANYINQYHIDTLLCLPTQYELILNEDENTLKSLNAVILAGEYASSSIYTKHLATTDHCRLYNAYGTTETSIWNSIYLCNDHLLEKSIPIGAPLENSLFNNNADDGALMIEGPCVCIGYLSGERFNNIYHTGDIVKKSSGIYTFLHRDSDYLKRNGIRLPSLDIINDIKQLPYVSNCNICSIDPFEIIVNQNDKPINEGDQYKIIQDIYKHLRKYYRNNQLPTKIHYRKLAASHKHLSNSNNPWEHILQKIFCESLGVENIDVNLSFFENGGDSLSAISLVSGINKYFNIEIEIDQIFQDSKIKSIIRYIHNDIDSPRTILQILKEVPSSPKIVVMFPPAAGMPFFYKNLINIINNINVVSILPPLKNIEDFKTITDYSAYCIGAIKQIKYKQIILAGFSYGAYWALETCHQLEMLGIAIEQLILIDAPPVFNRNINVDEQSQNFMNFIVKNSTISASDSSYNDTTYNKLKDLYKSQEQSLCHYKLPKSLLTPLFTITSAMVSDDPLFIEESYLNHWQDMQEYNFVSDTTINTKHETLFDTDNVKILSEIVSNILEIKHEHKI